MKKRELRLAVVLYGGVSLAVYMHGITKEIQKLVRASKILHGLQKSHRAGITYEEAIAPQSNRETDTEHHYFELLQAIGDCIDLRVLVDVVAGASAGGINAIMLSRSLAHDLPLDTHREMWLRGADISELMDPADQPRKWHRWYMRPLIRRWSKDKLNRLLADPESYRQFSLLVRGPWFRPPFSGERLSTMLLDALASMEYRCDSSESLLPGDHKLECLISVTDFFGYPQVLPLHDPPMIVEREHLHTWRFVHFQAVSGERISDFRSANIPGLALAARATSSYAGAFPPLQIVEIDRLLKKRKQAWPDRESFIQKTLSPLLQAGLNPCDASFIDGGVVNNKPFKNAIKAIMSRPAHCQIDRRLLFIDPNPQSSAALPPDSSPGFFRTLIGSLSTIPRNEPVQNDIDAILKLNRRIENIRGIVASCRAQVTESIRSVVDIDSIKTPSEQRLQDLRDCCTDVAAKDAGYTYAGYIHLRTSSLIDGIVDLLNRICHQNKRSPSSLQLHKALEAWAKASGILELQSDTDNRVIERFLRTFDVSYRMRRLRFVLRAINDLYQSSSIDDAASQSLGRAKKKTFTVLGKYQERLGVSFYGKTVCAEAEQIIANEKNILQRLTPLLQHLGEQLDLVAMDREMDALIADICREATSPEIRRDLLSAYLGFPFFDTAIFPLMRDDDSHELQAIKIDRISPQDVRDNCTAGGAARLKGIELGHFGAFFSRRSREHDYLRGRLDSASRLIDIVMSAVPEATHINALTFKHALFKSILDSEAQFLKHSDKLIREIRREVDHAVEKNNAHVH
ncbi:MAG: patatin-like protein [Proteobacteria bacterium]|nr:patatin-like protein [Pseudomonadota bacterium]